MVVVLLVAAGAAWESQALALLEKRPDVVVLKRCVDVDDLLATASAGQAEVAVVGLEAPGFDLAAADHLRRYGVRPVAVAPHDHPDAARSRASRIGVRSVISEDALGGLPALLLAGEPPSAPPELPLGSGPGEPPLASSGPGRVVVVWGPAGAPGRTTTAIGLAWALAQRGPTTLVDADGYGGSVAQVLGILDEVSGLLAAARLAGAGELAARHSTVARSVGPSLAVVTGLPRPDRWSEVRPGTVETLVEAAAEHGHVVVDAGFCLEDSPAGAGARPGRNQLTLAALAVAHEVLVVGTADPVGLARLARGLAELREKAGPAVPLRVVVNRMRPSLGWSEREVAEMIAGFASPRGLHFLPEDRATVDQALVSGRSLHETGPGSPLVTALERLADAVAPGASAPPRRRGLRRRRGGRARRR